MFKSLLIGLDGTTACTEALEVATALAKTAGASIQAVFVEGEQRFYYVPTPTALAGAAGATASVPIPLPPERMAEEEERAQEESERIRSTFSNACRRRDLEGTFFVLRGSIGQSLADQSRRVDLLILGRRSEGRGSPEVSPVGVTTEEVIRATPRPVLVIPSNGRRGDSIVVAYDASVAACRVIVSGAELASLQENPHIHVLTVAGSREKAARAQQEAREYLTPYGIPSSYVIREGHPQEVIVSYAREVEAGLICMGAYGERRLWEMIVGSTTTAVLRDAGCSILLMS